VFIAGSTTGTLGTASAGGYDIFAAKLGSTGSSQWIRQSGSSADEIGKAVSFEGSASNGSVYVAGGTSGTMSGTNAGGRDYVIIKYSGT
jgi:hypothetical protein